MLRFNFINKNNVYLSNAIANDDNLITYDYLSVNKYTFELDMFLNDLVDITNSYAFISYENDKNSKKKKYVMKVDSFDKETTEVTLTDILSSLDYTIFNKTNVNKYTSIEQYIYDLIDDVYVNSSDTLENIPLIELSKITDTAGTIKTAQNQTSFSEIIHEAFLNYSIVLEIVPNDDENKININIINKSANATINIKNDNNTIVSINNLNTEMITNKINYYDTNSLNKLGTYYLYNNNTVGNTNSPLRYKEVVTENKLVDSSADGYNLTDIANADLKLGVMSYEIDIQLLFLDDEEYPIYKYSDFYVGRRVKFYYNNTEIDTIISGITSVSTGVFTIKCGGNRDYLTNILNKYLK